MAGSKIIRTLRFFVVVDGAEKQVAALKIRADGDTLIFLPLCDNLETNKENISQTGRHYSIHRSRKSESGGMTVKETISLVGKPDLTFASFARPNDGFIGLIAATSSIPNLKPEKYDLCGKAGDEKILLAKDDLGSESLYLIFIASNKRLKVEEFNELRLAACTVTVDAELYITLVSVKSPIPSLPSVPTFRLSTSAPRLGPRPLLDLESVECESMTPEELPIFCFRIFNEMVMGIKDRHLKMIKELRRTGGDSEVLREAEMALTLITSFDEEFRAKFPLELRRIDVLIET